MTRRRIRRHAGSRCRDCDARVTWFLDAITGRPRKFDPRPVDGRTHTGRPAYPVENGRRVWTRVRELVEDLMVRRHCSEHDAREEAYDMPWYVAHDCPQGRGDQADSEKEDPSSWTG